MIQSKLSFKIQFMSRVKYAHSVVVSIVLSFIILDVTCKYTKQKTIATTNNYSCVYVVYI